MRAKFQAYLNQLFRQPVVERFQTPLRRRTIAVAVVVWEALAAGSLSLLAYDRVLPVIIAGIGMIYLLGMLNMSTRGIFELSDRHLDEFQIGLRDAAYRKSYFLALFWLLLVAPASALFDEHRLGDLYSLAFILLGFNWALSAPRVVVAWTAPADERED